MCSIHAGVQVVPENQWFRHFVLYHFNGYEARPAAPKSYSTLFKDSTTSMRLIEITKRFTITEKERVISAENRPASLSAGRTLRYPLRRWQPQTAAQYAEDKPAGNPNQGEYNAFAVQVHIGFHIVKPKHLQCGELPAAFFNIYIGKAEQHDERGRRRRVSEPPPRSTALTISKSYLAVLWCTKRWRHNPD